MIERKKKLLIKQLVLLFLGIIIIYFTYSKNNFFFKNKEIKTSINQNVITPDSKNTSNVFVNIEYAGIDLAGNRYKLKSKEAVTMLNNQDLIKMKGVNAIFYFKDDTILYIWSKTGIYNNKTLDMNFDGEVKAKYNKSELFADKAEYSNSKSFIIVSENVKINDVQVDLVADELYFDLKDQTLNIASFDKKNINANIKLNEKRF